MTPQSSSSKKPGWVAWSDDEKHTLLELLAEGMPVPHIARRLPGRTIKAIRAWLASHNYQLQAVRTSRSIRQVAALFGVPSDVADLWVARGWLKTYRYIASRAPRNTTKLRRPQFSISDHHLLQFIEYRPGWVTWEPHRITDPDWRSAAQDLRDRAGGHWLSVRDIAARYSYSQSAVWDWIKFGLLKVTRIVRADYVWSADLEGFSPPINSGLWAGRRRKPTTPPVAEPAPAPAPPASFPPTFSRKTTGLSADVEARIAAIVAREQSRRASTPRPALALGTPRERALAQHRQRQEQESHR